MPDPLALRFIFGNPARIAVYVLRLELPTGGDCAKNALRMKQFHGYGLKTLCANASLGYVATYRRRAQLDLVSEGGKSALFEVRFDCELGSAGD